MSSRLHNLFEALSSETRVKIIELLQERLYCVNAVAALLKITPAAVSQHMRFLEHRIGFSHARGVAQEYFQSPSFFLRALNLSQQ